MDLVQNPRNPRSSTGDKRRFDRQRLVVAGRLSWKDQRGTTRMANVVTRDVSEEGIYVEWKEPSAIPLYRLVHFQVTPDVRRTTDLPAPLRTGKVLSAVFRIGRRRKATGTPEGYALRMIVAPERARARSVGSAALIGQTA